MTQSTYRPTPPRCPDCDRILGHDHRPECKILAAKPLPSDTECLAWSRMNHAHLIAPHVPSLEPLAVLVRDEDIEGAR